MPSAYPALACIESAAGVDDCAPVAVAFRGIPRESPTRSTSLVLAPAVFLQLCSPCE